MDNDQTTQNHSPLNSQPDTAAQQPAVPPYEPKHSPTRFWFLIVLFALVIAGLIIVVLRSFLPANSNSQPAKQQNMQAEPMTEPTKGADTLPTIESELDDSSIQEVEEEFEQVDQELNQL